MISNEETKLKKRQIKNDINIYTTDVIIDLPKSIPFDVSSELNDYSKIYISREYDVFRNYHCCECYKDFKVYGELPDGDKKTLFVVKHHFECCPMCKGCMVYFPFCCSYSVCSDKIMFQLDYRRNNLNFYTQGINIKKGCYCCDCCCKYCCSVRLFLRENIDPDSPDFDVGKKKGETKGNIRSVICQDQIITYIDENGIQGHSLRLPACEICKYTCCCCCICRDYEITIETPTGLKAGNIFIPNGCCSQNVESCCYRPYRYFEINFPVNISSLEKFKIITEAIHFNHMIEFLE